MRIMDIDIRVSALKIWKPGASDPVKIETGKDFTGADSHLRARRRTRAGDELAPQFMAGSW